MTGISVAAFLECLLEGPMLKEEIAAMKSNDEKEEYVFEEVFKMVESNDYQRVLSLISNLQNDWEGLTTARLTKIIRNICERIPITMSTYKDVLDLLNGLIRSFESKKMLRIELECKQIHVYLNAGLYNECLEKIIKLLPELKKYDDKINIISLHIYESRAYYEIKDFPRAKSALTSARALAVRTACPSYLQAQIDLLNGMYLSDERAHETALSYFIESVEGFIFDKMYGNAKIALRYIILSKVLSGDIEEIRYVLEAKYASKIKDDEYVQLLLDVSRAFKKRDIRLYNEIISVNSVLVESDKYIHRHLQSLYNSLLDKNILKLIEPYSHIKISYIASKLGFEEEFIEEKLRKMILDEIIPGVLDHLTQCLIIFPEKDTNEYTPLEEIQALLEGISVD